LPYPIRRLLRCGRIAPRTPAPHRVGPFCLFSCFFFFSFPPCFHFSFFFLFPLTFVFYFFPVLLFSVFVFKRFNFLISFIISNNVCVFQKKMFIKFEKNSHHFKKLFIMLRWGRLAPRTPRRTWPAHLDSFFFSICLHLSFSSCFLFGLLFFLFSC
jgi:hypothetical protein